MVEELYIYIYEKTWYMQDTVLSMVSDIHLEHIPLWIMGTTVFPKHVSFYIRLQHSHAFESQNRPYQGARF